MNGWQLSEAADTKLNGNNGRKAVNVGCLEDARFQSHSESITGDSASTSD